MFDYSRPEICRLRHRSLQGQIADYLYYSMMSWKPTKGMLYVNLHF